MRTFVTFLPGFGITVATVFLYPTLLDQGYIRPNFYVLPILTLICLVCFIAPALVHYRALRVFLWVENRFGVRYPSITLLVITMIGAAFGGILAYGGTILFRNHKKHIEELIRRESNRVPEKPPEAKMVDSIPTPVEVKPAMPPTPVQLDASVTLSSGSFDESCGMWISFGYGTGKLLAPANVAANLRATNLTDHPIRILEILGTVGEDPTKSYLYRLPFYETKLFFGDLKSPGALHQLISTTTERSLSFQENAANPIPARKSVDGWVLFEYPSGLTGVDARSVRFVARTDYGDIPVSGVGMETFTGGGARFKPLPDAIDFREYHVERYSTFIKRSPTP